MNTAKAINRTFSKEWIEDLKSLPKYQRCEIIKAAKIYGQVQKFKMGIISRQQLENILNEFLRPNPLG